MSVAAELALRATLLIGLAWLAAAALGRFGASAAMRHVAWQLGFLALLLLPLIAAAVPALPLAVLPEAAAAPAQTAGATALPTYPPAMLVIYVTVTALLVARHLAVRLLLARCWRSARAPDRGWETLLDALARELGVRRKVGLRLGARTAMPMTWGTFAPKLILPADAAGWPAEQLRLVLLHELAHVRRGDSLMRTAAALACALYWFHPAVWPAARRLRLEQELAADDLVLAAGAQAQGYARDLLALAASLGRSHATAAAPAMAAGSQLERRIAAIVGRASRRRPSVAFAATCSAIALMATVLIAAAVPVAGAAPTSTARAAPPVFAEPTIAAAATSPHAPGPVRRHSPLREPARTRAEHQAAPAAAGMPALPAPPAIAAIEATPPIPAIPAVPALPAVPAVPATPPR